MSGPPKEGKPAGVDRLARIETYWRSTVIAEPDGMARDVLALVEIAKAARPFVEDYDFHAADYLAERVDGEEARVFTARTVALLIEHQRILRAALARLAPPAEDQGDSGATEGDA